MPPIPPPNMPPLALLNPPGHYPWRRWYRVSVLCPQAVATRMVLGAGDGDGGTAAVDGIMTPSRWPMRWSLAWRRASFDPPAQGGGAIPPAQG